MTTYKHSNLNFYIKFKPKESGHEIYRQHICNLFPEELPTGVSMNLIYEEDGYVRMQMHEFMKIFGSEFVIGLFPIIEMDVLLEVYK